MAKKDLTRWRLVGSLLIASALVLSSLMLTSQPAYSLSTTVTTDKAQQGVEPSYSLGQAVTIVGSVGLNQGELKNITVVTLRIQGLQPLDINLPLAAGQYNLTSNLPKDGQGNPLGSLTCTVAWQNVTYGYGYGYIGGTGGGQISYTCQYTPPAIRYPPPMAVAPINNPNFAFNVPGGGFQEQELEANLLYSVPGVPGAPPGSTPLGLAMHPTTPTLYILVDGTANDIVLQVDADTGAVFNFTDTGVTDARGVAIVNNDLYEPVP